MPQKYALSLLCASEAVSSRPVYPHHYLRRAEKKCLRAAPGRPRAVRRCHVVRIIMFDKY